MGAATEIELISGLKLLSSKATVANLSSELLSSSSRVVCSVLLSCCAIRSIGEYLPLAVGNVAWKLEGFYPTGEDSMRK